MLSSCSRMLKLDTTAAQLANISSEGEVIINSKTLGSSSTRLVIFVASIASKAIASHFIFKSGDSRILTMTQEIFAFWRIKSLFSSLAARFLKVQREWNDISGFSSMRSIKRGIYPPKPIFSSFFVEIDKFRIVATVCRVRVGIESRGSRIGRAPIIKYQGIHTFLNNLNLKVFIGREVPQAENRLTRNYKQ
jgi:hypothetical protein